MEGHIPVPHPAIHLERQLHTGVQVHLGAGEEGGQEGRTEEFNEEFYKTVERGVFNEITREEMAA